jgi:hypothetical protein
VGNIARAGCCGKLFWWALRSGMGECDDPDQQRVRVEMLLAFPLQRLRLAINGTANAAVFPSFGMAALLRCFNCCPHRTRRELLVES